MRGRRVKSIEWNGSEASANDLAYAIFSEHVRGESRFYWPMVQVNGKWRRLNDEGLHVRVEEPDGYTGTKAQAQRYAALHAEAVGGARIRGEPTPASPIELS